MTEGEIAERFILAAELERRLPRTGERPQGYGGYVLPYVHSEEDMKGWGRRLGERDMLLPEDSDRHAAHRREFWEGRTTRPSAADITAWEECLRWTAELLSDEGQRRALWAWAFAKAGGRSFARWCKKTEHIHEETGRRRKDRALTLISTQLSRKDMQHSQSGTDGVLPVGPEIGDVSATIGDERSYSWHSDDAFQPFLSDEPGDFSWSAKRNERRRQQEARRKAAA